MLISRSLDIGLVSEVKQLQEIDQQLWYLLKQVRKLFDLVGHIAGGRVLLVGEGNLSFSLSLTRKQRLHGQNLTATTFETASQLSKQGLINAEKLKAAGVTVGHGIDASKLHQYFGRQFDHIIFQFPHAGTREPIDGRNPNFVLVRDFLISAAKVLRPSGSVLISAVDTPHYHGAFQFEEAVQMAGLKIFEVYQFDPSDFPGYHHTMTNEGSSALANHHNFATWVFER